MDKKKFIIIIFALAVAAFAINAGTNAIFKMGDMELEINKQVKEAISEISPEYEEKLMAMLERVEELEKQRKHMYVIKIADMDMRNIMLKMLDIFPKLKNHKTLIWWHIQDGVNWVEGDRAIGYMIDPDGTMAESGHENRKMTDAPHRRDALLQPNKIIFSVNVPDLDMDYINNLKNAGYPYEVINDPARKLVYGGVAHLATAYCNEPFGLIATDKPVRTQQDVEDFILISTHHLPSLKTFIEKQVLTQNPDLQKIRCK